MNPSKGTGFLDRIIKTIMKAVGAAVGVCIGSAVICVTLQIFTRYVLRNSLWWTEQATRYFFMWSVFLGIPLAFYEGSTFAFDVLLKKAGEKVRRALDIFIRLSGIVFCGYYFYWSLQLCIRGGGAITSGIEIPYNFLYIGQPICAFLLMLVFTNEIVKIVASRKKEAL